MNTYLALLFIIINLLPVSLSCETKTELSGTISDSLSVIGSKCWIIEVPDGSYTRLNIQQLTSPVACIYSKLEISVPGTGDLYTVCPRVSNGMQFRGLSDVNITLISKTRYNTTFTLNYTTESFACIGKNHFRCSEHICITEDKVCDGVNDCENGADEENCDTSVGSIRGVNASRANSVKWLNSKRTGPSGWGPNTHRAVIALYLANETYFNTSELEKEFVVKQLALLTTITLKNDATYPITVNELSMYINALRVTCHDPKDFYGINLLKKLSDGLSSVSPAAYLTLCNANEEISNDAIKSLFGMFSKDLSPPFSLDVQAMTVMALTCIKNKGTGFENSGVENADKLYTDALGRLISSQLPDGSFGNRYTTALVTQALLSAAQEKNKTWRLKLTIQNLMNKLNSPSVDLLLTYITLPILNGKSLTSIGAVKCPNMRKPAFEFGKDINNKEDGKDSNNVGDGNDNNNKERVKGNEETAMMDVYNSFPNGDQKAAFLIHKLKTLGNVIDKITSVTKVAASKYRS